MLLKWPEFNVIILINSRKKQRYSGKCYHNTVMVPFVVHHDFDAIRPKLFWRLPIFGKIRNYGTFYTHKKTKTFQTGFWVGFNCLMSIIKVKLERNPRILVFVWFRRSSKISFNSTRNNIYRNSSWKGFRSNGSQRPELNAFLPVVHAHFGLWFDFRVSIHKSFLFESG